MGEIDFSTPVTWIAAGSTFLLVASIWFSGMILLRLRRQWAAEKIESRLQLEKGAHRDAPWSLQLWRDGQMVAAFGPGQSWRERYALRLETLRKTLGWRMSAISVMLMYAGFILLTAGAALVFTENIVFALMAGMAAAVGPYIYVQRQFDRQNALFERQFAEALGLATRSLRAGQPLMGAFRLIVEEMDPPVSLIFEEICQQQALGVSLDEAVHHVAQNTTSSDLKLFAASMGIQIRSGGNVADMMDRLADVIRDRMRLHRRARVLTAQTQLSKRVLIVIPFIIFTLLYLLNRDYLAPLYQTPIGRSMLLVACIFLVLGRWVMNRIAVLRY